MVEITHSRPVIGIDLDNTVICYDRAYCKLADELGVEIGVDEDPRKAVRSYCFNEDYGNLTWTLLQGRLYGNQILDAELFPDALKAIQTFINQGFAVRIISHKTRYSAVGPVYDFHRAAVGFIESKILRALGRSESPFFSYVFCPTLEEKILEIKNSNCVVFIDDLETVLQHSQFPKNTEKVHFQNKMGKAWEDILDQFFVNEVSKNSNQPVAEQIERSSLEQCFSNLLCSIGESLKEMTPLSGGINNSVYKVLCQSGNVVCAKYYRRDLEDSRDRMLHEVRFLEYCEENQIDCVPKVISKDWGDGAILMSFVFGEIWSENHPVPIALWTQFSEFFKLLQKYKNTKSAKLLPQAAEGARSIQEHLGFVQRRRDYWRRRAENDEVDVKFKTRILGELEEEYQNVAENSIRLDQFKSEFSVENSIISTSDFGLNNCLIDADQKVWFLDFEYAGWDDLAKAVVDFSEQPRYPPPSDFCLYPIEKTSGLECIRQILQLKWKFIILANEVRRKTNYEGTTIPSAH